MTTTQATAQVFWTAFRALKKRERQAIMQKLVADAETREDLRYSVIIEDRKKEPRIWLDDYLAQRAGKKK
jgi:hypothetical protein